MPVATQALTREFMRRRVPAEPEFIDLAWYLQALVPALVTAGLEGYEAKEIRH